MTTIIVPTYNEAKNILPLLRELTACVPDAHILVVDDSSPDGTGMVVQEFAHENSSVELLSRSGKEGLGKAYLAAFEHLLRNNNNEIVVMMDADFSHDPVYVPVLIDAVQNIGVAIGSRYVPGGKTIGWERWRRLLSSLGNQYARRIIRHPVHDVTAGFYAIRAEHLRAINLSAFDASGYAFQIELKHMLRRAGATFTEIPIQFKNRREGESKLSGHIISEGIIAPWKLIWKQ